MKKLLAIIFVSLALCACNGKGNARQVEKYVSQDSSMLYTFIGNDSLYIDMYGSGCGVSAYKLEREQDSFYYHEERYDPLLDEVLVDSGKLYVKPIEYTLFHSDRSLHEYEISFSDGTKDTITQFRDRAN